MLIRSLFIAFVVFLLTSFADELRKTDAENVVAPITYKDTLLIVSDSKGVASFVFHDNNKNGVKYQYIYESNDGLTKSAGSGIVYENYKILPLKDKDMKNFLIDDGSKLYLIAETIKIKWSVRSADQCYIYYLPEKFRISLAASADFGKISLSRFKFK